MDFLNLIPKSHERGILAGMTETGKSTLARNILTYAPYPLLLIIDPKGTFKYPGVIVTDPDQIPAAFSRSDVVIFRPSYEFMTMEDYDRVLKWAYLKQNIFVYIDEVFGLSDNGYTYPPALKAIYTRGRELNIGVLAGTQRPSGIPLYVISESNHFYVYQLQVEADRKRLAGIMGKPALTMMQDHDFLYFYNKGGERARIMSLDLAERGA